MNSNRHNQNHEDSVFASRTHNYNQSSNKYISTDYIRLQHYCLLVMPGYPRSSKLAVFIEEQQQLAQSNSQDWCFRFIFLLAGIFYNGLFLLWLWEILWALLLLLPIMHATAYIICWKVLPYICGALELEEATLLDDR
jgi:hypothetical protein